MAISPAMYPPEPALNGAAPPLDIQIEPDMGGYDVENVPDMEMPEEGGDPALEHRANLAEYLDEEDLQAIATELIELIEADNQSRADWIDSYTSGLDYLGFKGEDRSEPFKGSCGVYHPVLTEAAVRFQSNAIMEIFPASGPALTKIIGDDSPEKVAQAKRVKEELNYQLTENMSEYRNETEQMLFRLPLAGSAFKKVYYDPLRKRPSACMIPAEDFIIDYGASDLDLAERYTHVMKKTPNQVKKLQRAGFYSKSVVLQKPAFESPPSGKEKEDEILGIEPTPQVDNRHVLWEVHAAYNLPGVFEDPDGVADPYIITIEKQSQKVLSIYRNWKVDDDQDRVNEQYFVHYQYMPGLGFYGIGLIHLIGSIAKAATSILRQLIDAGTLSNLPGGLKTRGLRTKGDDTPIAPGEWRDVDVPAGTIAQNLFPMPYKEPSAVLATLLASLVEEGRRVGSIADMEITSQSMNAPVGTTLALLERSLKVMTAVHARLHASMRREFRLIGKCIFDYMDEKYLWDESGKFNRRQDFDGRVDIVPVSDPNASTQAQKIVQMQAVMQQAAMNPEIYNIKELHRAGLQAIGIKNDERILPLDNPPPRMDPVQENMAMLTSQPVKVFPDQDHTAHIQVHLSMVTDPKILEMLKASPSAAKVQGAMEAHLAEHLAFQYHDEIQQMMGVALPPLGEQQPPEVEAMLSRALADASVRLRELHEAQAQKKQAEAVASDPVYQLREREVALKEKVQEHKEKEAAVDKVLDVAKEAKEEQQFYANLDSEERRAGAKIGADMITFGKELDNEQRMEGIKLGREVTEKIRDQQFDDELDLRDRFEAIDERDRDDFNKQADRETKERIEARKAEAAKIKARAKPKASK